MFRNLHGIVTHTARSSMDYHFFSGLDVSMTYKGLPCGERSECGCGSFFKRNVYRFSCEMFCRRRHILSICTAMPWKIYQSEDGIASLEIFHLWTDGFNNSSHVPTDDSMFT